MDITIDGYLTEQKLRQVLQQIIGMENWIGNEIGVLKTLKRWDMGFKYNNQIYIVEFDGHNHYRDPLLIKSDREKDKIANDLNYITIRIPYFIQLTNQTFEYYFPNINKKDINIVQNFKHGFIDKKAMLPASFCRLGLNKYHKQYNDLSKNIQIEIQKSLTNKINEFGVEYVLAF